MRTWKVGALAVGLALLGALYVSRIEPEVSLPEGSRVTVSVFGQACPAREIVEPVVLEALVIDGMPVDLPVIHAVGFEQRGAALGHRPKVGKCDNCHPPLDPCPPPCRQRE